MNKIVKIGGVVVLCCATFAGGFFTNKYLVKEEKPTPEKPVEEKVISKDLDTNSVLVRVLMNQVAEIENGTSNRHWMFADLSNGITDIVNKPSKNFIAAEATEEVKMQILGMSLDEKDSVFISTSECDSAETTIGNRTKACSVYTQEKSLYYTTHKYTKAYSKKYIESLYKQLYGQDAQLDTSVDINIDYYKIYTLHYNPTIDKYIYYVETHGGVGGTTAGLEELTITSARQEGDKIIIKEKEVISTADANKPTYYYTYTFQEDNGFYKFVSKIRDE